MSLNPNTNRCSNGDLRMSIDLFYSTVKFVLVAVAILEDCCMTSADMQWLFTQVMESWPMGLLIEIALHSSR